jgi:hypothetical protein
MANRKLKTLRIWERLKEKRAEQSYLNEQKKKAKGARMEKPPRGLARSIAKHQMQATGVTRMNKKRTSTDPSKTKASFFSENWRRYSMLAVVKRPSTRNRGDAK